jgi:agmatinase
MVKSTETFTAKIVVNGKFPVMLGGEHLVTLGAFQAVAKKYPDACIVHFDAHTDLRDNYEGEKLNHATVIRRCFDIVGANRIFQFGIRSGERQEFEFASKNTFLTKNNFDGLTNALKKIGNRPIYFTIDLDVLDPSEMGGTGTPEAGGVRFLELLDAAKKVFSANVVACDINELCPAVDTNGASTALACKFLREILLLVK